MTTVNGQEVTVQQTEDWEPFVPPTGPVEAAKVNSASPTIVGKTATVNVTTATPEEQVDVEYKSPSGDKFSQTTRSDRNKNLTLSRELNETGEWEVKITTESLEAQQTEGWEPFIPTGLEVQQTEGWENGTF